MIGLYDDNGVRLSITYNSLVLNNPADDPLETYEVNTVTIADAIDTVMDSDPSDDGSETGPVRKAMYVVRIDGVIRASTQKKLFDKKKALAAAFDPALVARNNPTTFGLIALDFSTPTEDGAFPAGFIPCRYYARARKMPIPPISVYTGTSAYFTVELLVADPRRYYQTQESKIGSGVATNSGDYQTWPTVTITMAGAGSATYSVDVAPDGYQPLVLNLSGRANLDVVTIDMKNRKISVNGVETPSLYVSGEYFPLSPGGNTIALLNIANATTVTTWYRAWAV